MQGQPTESGGIARWPTVDLGTPIGVSRFDARTAVQAEILMSGQSQGLFAAVDERRVVIVEHAESLLDHSFMTQFPPESALVLVATGRLPTSRARRAPARASTKTKPEQAAKDLPASVTAAGGRVEAVPRLTPAEVPGWIIARATLLGLDLAQEAVQELATAVGADADRVEQELAKLSAFAGAKRIETADVRALVAGAIESDVFTLAEAVVRQDAGKALAQLDQLFADGQAAQQILALLVWQFRVLLFASAMKSNDDAARMAKAIGASSPNVLFRWQAQARRASRASVTQAYETLHAADMAIKQGRTDPETALMLCVLSLCGVESADPRELVAGEPPHR